MTDFGEIYNLGTHDISSKVQYSAIAVGSSTGVIASTTSSISLNNTTFVKHRYSDRYPVVYCIDNPDSDIIEYAVMTNNYTYFKVYKVTLGGSPSISLASSTAISIDCSEKIVFGIKRVDEDNYCVYYSGFDRVGYYTSPGLFAIRKLSINVGVGYTDTLLFSRAIALAWQQTDSIIIDRVGHVLICKGYPTYANPTYYEMYHYTLDMETEAVGGGLIYTSPYGYNWSDGAMASWCAQSNGAFHWGSFYIQYSGGVISTYIVVNGVATLICSYGSGSPPTSQGWLYWLTQQYNSTDYIVAPSYGANNGTDYTMVQVHNGIISTYTQAGRDRIVPDGSGRGGGFVTINSGNVPAICWVSGTPYWVDDKELAIYGDQVLFPGYSVNAVLPTEDSLTGDIYIVDSFDHILAVDPTTHSITRVHDIVMGATNRCFNHGNFYFRWTNTVLYAVYLIATYETPLNKNVSILEWN